MTFVPLLQKEHRGGPDSGLPLKNTVRLAQASRTVFSFFASASNAMEAVHSGGAGRSLGVRRGKRVHHTTVAK